MLRQHSSRQTNKQRTSTLDASKLPNSAHNTRAAAASYFARGESGPRGTRKTAAVRLCPPYPPPPRVVRRRSDNRASSPRSNELGGNQEYWLHMLYVARKDCPNAKMNPFKWYCGLVVIWYARMSSATFLISSSLPRRTHRLVAAQSDSDADSNPMFVSKLTDMYCLLILDMWWNWINIRSSISNSDPVQFPCSAN